MAYNQVTSGNVSPTVIAYSGGGDAGWLVGLSLSTITAALAGAASITIRWTDPAAGAQAKTVSILLGLADHKDALQYCWTENGTGITIEAAVSGVLGTPSYSINASVFQG